LKVRADIAYKPYHLIELVKRLREFESEQYSGYLVSIERWVSMVVGNTPNPRTLTVDGEVICIGGISLLWTGVGEGWLIGSKLLESNPIYVQKRTLFHLQDALVKNDLHRIQATTVVGNELTYRWAISLGFQLEGNMCKYGVDGKDYYMYGRIS